TFNYNGVNNALQTITQTWNGSTHTWATFSLGDVPVQPNFQYLAVNGPNANSISGLMQVILEDHSYYQFAYNPYGQMYKVSYYGADSVLRSYTSINLPLNNSVAQ